MKLVHPIIRNRRLRFPLDPAIEGKIDIPRGLPLGQFQNPRITLPQVTFAIPEITHTFVRKSFACGWDATFLIAAKDRQIDGIDAYIWIFDRFKYLALEFGGPPKTTRSSGREQQYEPHFALIPIELVTQFFHVCRVALVI